MCLWYREEDRERRKRSPRSFRSGVWELVHPHVSGFTGVKTCFGAEHGLGFATPLPCPLLAVCVPLPGSSVTNK